jgi:hypothetical protein
MFAEPLTDTTGTAARMVDFTPPSPFRIPVAVLLGLAVPPLGLLAWIGLSGSRRRDYLHSKWVYWGFLLVVLSAAPLIFVAAAASLGLWPDPNPNPIGLGLLLVAGSGLGTVLAALGVLSVSRN